MRNSLPMLIITMIIIIAATYFSWQGFSMYRQASQETQNFQQIQTEYFSLEKSIRDNAATDSELNKQLIQINNYPTIISDLESSGLSNILISLLLVLLGILISVATLPDRMCIINKKK